MRDTMIFMKIIFIGSIVLNIILIGGIYHFYHSNIRDLSPIPESSFSSAGQPLAKYSYPYLREMTFQPQDILFDKIKEEDDRNMTRLFTYQVEGKKVSGIAHFPVTEGEYPVIIMVRGYVDTEIYEPGIGSNPMASYFTKNGFITLAPDFLGYGNSDDPPDEPFAGRFISYSTILQLIANVKNLNSSLTKVQSISKTKEDMVGIWAHSNGGQIALSVLAVSKHHIPTVLWAPVSKPFPYSVLYYTDEFYDNGRYLRDITAEFEKNYDIEKYSITNYLDWIQSPIQLHQGGADDEVPLEWSNELYDKMTTLKKDIEYLTYSKADHNMIPDWNTVAQNSTRFFKNHLQ